MKDARFKNGSRMSREIDGPVRAEVSWGIGHNNELDTMYGEPIAVKPIKLTRLLWKCHVVRMSSS